MIAYQPIISELDAVTSYMPTITQRLVVLHHMNLPPLMMTYKSVLVRQMCHNVNVQINTFWHLQCTQLSIPETHMIPQTDRQTDSLKRVPASVLEAHIFYPTIHLIGVNPL